MSLISVTNVELLNNPSAFTSPFQFEISFECIAPVKEELEWKLVYVGSAEDESHDQELDSVLVGPIIVGKNKFVFEAAAPDAALIPHKDLMEVTVLLLTCAYKEKEFIRIGYYVNSEYPPQEKALVEQREAWLAHQAQLQAEYAAAVNAVKEREDAMRAAGQLLEGAGLPMPPQPVLPPPPAVDITKLHRNILADKPRVTRFQIPWDQVDTTNEFAMAADDAAEANQSLAAEGEHKTGEGDAMAEDGSEESDEDAEMEDDGEQEGSGEDEEEETME